MHHKLSGLTPSGCLVAIFELHKGTLSAKMIGSIVQGHLKPLLPHYTTKALKGIEGRGAAEGNWLR